VSRLLVVAGEGSGDRIAAAAVRVVNGWGVECFGLGGPACRAAGVELVADTSSTAAMGLVDVARRAPAIARAAARIVREVAKRPPEAALLVDYTELNALLGRWLRARGVRVLWCVAPQAWAWRPGRLKTLGASLDRLAVVLPFEEKLWRDAGVDARYVGHPALDVPILPRDAARARLGIGANARVLGLLPGSRPGEIRRLAPVFAEAATRVIRAGHADAAVMLRAPTLDGAAREILNRAAAAAGVRVADADPEHGAAPLVRAFDGVLCASGTASLEVALAGVPVVVAYRMDRVAWAVARRMVRVPDVALPNVLAGERVVPELMQGEATTEGLAGAARGMMGEREMERARELGERLRRGMAVDDGREFGQRVAGLLTRSLARG
jgi:lipid-A-disaccharide synthase